MPSANKKKRAAFPLAASAVAAVFALAALAGPRVARGDGERRVYVVAAVGDSLTDPRSGGGLYLRELQSRCPASRFDAYGKGGEMVNQMRRRFERDLFGEAGGPPRPRYTHAIVFGGVNDLYSDLTAHRTVPRIEDDLAAMYAVARAHHVAVVAITVSPWGGFRRYYNPARAATTAEVNGWIFAQRDAGAVDFVVDAHTLLRCGDPDALCDRYATPLHDGIHFGPEGHRRLAEALASDVFGDCR